MTGIRADVTDRLIALCRKTGKVALLVHWYKTDVETEQISLYRILRCACNELSSLARNLAEDEVLIAAVTRAD